MLGLTGSGIGPNALTRLMSILGFIYNSKVGQDTSLWGDKKIKEIVVLVQSKNEKYRQS